MISNGISVANHNGGEECVDVFKRRVSTREAGALRERGNMNKALTLGAGIGLGTGAMFLLDPDRGKRRRALLRDKIIWAARKTGDAIDTTARDVRNRAHGVAAELQSKLSGTEIDDGTLRERIRSKLGRVVSHPSAVDVMVENGTVTLRGPILASEVSGTESCVKNVLGVKEVRNELEVHDAAEHHPALQGGRERPGHRFEFLQENWSPTARLVAGAAGATLAAYGGSRKDALGAGMGAAGLLLLARGLTNVNLKNMASFTHLTSKGENAKKATVH